MAKENRGLYNMEDRFVIFTGTICSTYLGRMRDYALRDLENETKKEKLILKFSKIVEKFIMKQDRAFELFI